MKHWLCRLITFTFRPKSECDSFIFYKPLKRFLRWTHAPSHPHTYIPTLKIPSFRGGRGPPKNMKKFMYIDLVDDNYHPRMIEWYVVTPNLVHPFGQKKSAFAKDIWESHPYSYTCYEVRISLSFIIAQVSLGQ